MVAPGKNHLKQKRSVSMALFLTQNLFVASGIDHLSYPTGEMRENEIDRMENRVSTENSPEYTLCCGEIRLIPCE